MTMEKYYEEWDGKKFPVRKVELPEELGGFEAKVAEADLWFSIADDYYNGNKDANAIDDSIYFYCDSGFIASDPTDKEIIDYLIEHGC